MKSSFDNLSRALQTVNGGEGVSLQAAYAGSIFVALLSRDPDKFQASVDALSRTITLLTSQIDAINVFSPVVGPRIYTGSRPWKSGWMMGSSPVFTAQKTQTGD
jgi:hypothetical protein